MTLYLARKVGADHAVDETSTVYIGRCDVDDCRYMVDHRDVEIVNDALDGHRRRAHPAPDPEALNRGWMTFASPHPVAVANDVANTPGPRLADPIGMHPSPTPRAQETP